MKSIFLICLGFILFSCKETGIVKDPDKIQRYLDSKVTTIQYEGCEYIIYNGVDGENIIHKQNCKLCSERAENKTQ